MTYKETLDFLYAQLPQYQKIGAAAYKANLDNIVALCDILDNPQNQLKVIHVAGTNGKGSVCNMLASVFQESGYTTGLFTSPHIIDFRERIRINGEMISKDFIIDFVSNFQDQFSKINPSFFEWSTALAFYYFSQKKVDIVILETGLGGRLDSTNIVTPILSIITSIGIDHTSFLGNTLEEIAFEKAGIIKPSVPVVLGEQTKNVQHVFEKIAKERNAFIHYSQVQDSDPTTSLIGTFQNFNVATVLHSINIVKEEYPKITSSNLAKGLKAVQENTGLRGRWETLQSAPKTIADIGHNSHAIKETVKQLQSEKHNQLHIVWGMVEDKDISEIIKLLPENANYYLCNPDIKRAMPAVELANYFPKNYKTTVYLSCNEAFSAALKTAYPEDLILAGGSTFVVSEIISDFFQ